MEVGEEYQRYKYNELATVAASGIKCEPREKMKRIAGSVEEGLGVFELVERAVDARRGESKMERERIVPAVRRVVVVASVWARRMVVEGFVVVVILFLMGERDVL